MSEDKFEEQFPSLKNKRKDHTELSAQTHEIAIYYFFNQKDIQENCVDKKKLEKYIDTRIKELFDHKVNLGLAGRRKYHLVINEFKTLKKRFGL